MPLTNQSQLIAMLARFRKEAEKGDLTAIRQLVDAYSKIYRRLLTGLDLEVRRIWEDGGDGVSRVYVAKRLADLYEQVQEELLRYQSVVGSAIDVSTDSSLLLGGKHAVELMKLATFGQANILSVDFNKLPKAAIESLLGFLQPNSPLYKRLNLIAKYHSPIIRDQLIEAIALGYNPYKAGRNIAPFLADIAAKFQVMMARPLSDAIRMARTAMLWAYREAGRANYQANGDVVTGWQWYAEVDSPNVCISCVVMHGTIHPLDEPLNDHHNGRCTAVPVVLGQALISETAGIDHFNNMSEESQRAMLGPGAFDALQSGAFDLSQLTHEVDDDVYGLMRSVTPLKDLVTQ